MQEQTPVVNDELTTQQPSEGTTPEVIIKEEIALPPAHEAGSKTDSNLLLKSLHEERDKRRALEEEIELLKSSVITSDEVYSDEGLALKKHISTIEEKLISLEEEKNFEKLFNQYPLLKEKADEFIEFRKAEHPRAKLESVAKLYLAENGLLDQQRKGLEKPTGGQRTPPISGMTTDDVANLRKNNFKKYQELIMKGQLKIEA